VLEIPVKAELPFQIPGRTASFLLESVCFRLFLTCLHREVSVQFTVVLEGEKFFGLFQKKKNARRNMEQQ